METKPSIIKTGKWDTFYSTYWWNIYLDPEHPDNTTERLTGYSKKEGESEAQDKDQLLKRKILNFYLNGYFKRIKYIEFFLRAENMIDKKRDPKILLIYPDHYDIPEMNHDVIFKKFGAFLHDFYDRVQHNKDMNAMLPKGNKKITSKDDFLNTEKQFFKSIAHLYAHAARLLRYGHAPGEVEAFIQRYKQLKSW